MIIPLIKKELKSNYKIFILFAVIITLYSTIIITMYDPKLNESINMLAKSMPELFAAFSMMDPGLTLIDFIINYLYGFILIVIPFIFIIIMCYRLLAKYIDDGSFAYLLNSSYSRICIIINQYLILLFYMFILILYSSCFIYMFSYIQFHESIDVLAFITLNIGLLALHVFISTLCFFIACLFNELKYSVGIGAIMNMIFVLIQMLSNINDKGGFLKYLTPLTLFQPKELVDFQLNSFLQTGLFVLITMILVVIMIDRFKKKDLLL